SKAEKVGLMAGTEAVRYGNSRNSKIIYLGGDVITAIDGEAVTNLADYYSLLESKRPGDIVKVTVYRSGKYVDLRIELEE
ncbi:MAG: PDZ domain-containing protein, partial [Spirochaetaceae bacterium]|nr:PDZ domain-containing protein [Spirochaetaceae bacterium]